MIFLGQASNYSFRRICRHLFAHGRRSDYDHLRSVLAARYHTPVESVALYHSGRSALTVALRSVAAPGTKVILPGLTCIAVLRAVRAADCVPVFCDIRPQDLSYDPASLDKTAKKCRDGVLLVQNTLGIAWDIQSLEQVANKYHLKIVEDLAHSVGRLYPDGREAGTVGVATILSFGKGKAIDTINGGAAIIRHPRTSASTSSPHSRPSSSPQSSASRPTPSSAPTTSRSAVSSHAAPFSLPQPTRIPPLSDRLRDRWYPVFGGLTRTLWPLGLGRPLLSLLVRAHFIKRSGDTELDPDLRLPAWQCRLAERQLASIPAASLPPLREHFYVRDRAQCLSELASHGYHLSEIWYDTPVAPARCAAEADFPASACPNTVRIADAIVNLPSWLPPRKLTTARSIIAQYQINLSQELKNA